MPAPVVLSTVAAFVPVAIAPMLPCPAGTLLGTVTVLPRNWVGTCSFDNSAIKAVLISPAAYTVVLATALPTGTADIDYQTTMATDP